MRLGDRRRGLGTIAAALALAAAGVLASGALGGREATPQQKAIALVEKSLANELHAQDRLRLALRTESKGARGAALADMELTLQRAVTDLGEAEDVLDGVRGTHSAQQAIGFALRVDKTLIERSPGEINSTDVARIKLAIDRKHEAIRLLKKPTGSQPKPSTTTTATSRLIDKVEIPATPGSIVRTQHSFKREAKYVVVAEGVIKQRVAVGAEPADCDWFYCVFSGETTQRFIEAVNVVEGRRGAAIGASIFFLFGGQSVKFRPDHVYRTEAKLLFMEGRAAFKFLLPCPAGCTGQLTLSFFAQS